MQLGKKSEEQHRQCRERQQLFERKTELGLGANLDFLGNCPSSHQCSTLYLCCCFQEKWTDHRLNLLRWENFKVEKIPLGMIETCCDNGANATTTTRIEGAHAISSLVWPVRQSRLLLNILTLDLQTSGCVPHTHISHVSLGERYRSCRKKKNIYRENCIFLP